MTRIRAVVVPVFAAHVALLTLFLFVAEPVSPWVLQRIEHARATCASFPGGPLRLVEGGTIVAGRVAQPLLSLLLLGPWPELVTPLVVPRCALRAPLPWTFMPTLRGSYAVMALSLLLGTVFWTVASLAAARVISGRWDTRTSTVRPARIA